MNIQQLARARAKAAAHLEALAGWEVSTDREEALQYANAQRAYKLTEATFQSAIACFTTNELASLGIAA